MKTGHVRALPVAESLQVGRRALLPVLSKAVCYGS